MVRSVVIVLAVFTIPASAQQAPSDATRLTIDRIFASDEFHGEPVPAVKWLAGGAYTTTRPSVTRPGGTDLVRIDGTGKVEVLVAAEKLIPPGATEPLPVDGYEFSADLDFVLIYTNSVKVWRENTRGDYWTYRRSTGALAKVDKDAAPSTLMFAKLSPDGRRVGYVRGNNLYVAEMAGGKPLALTTDGTDQIINGTFDWVYEEEFDCRDGWRWSPDGQSIAYWQLDTRGVKTFTLVDDTSGTYQRMKTFAYPKAGERNSACRVGVVPVSGALTTWAVIPGDTRTDYYLPRMEWAEGGKELILQRVNRLQNAVDVMLADTATGQVRTVMIDRDGAWVDLADDAGLWLESGKAFSWVSERDGWRHLYVAARDGSSIRRVTTGAFDVVKVLSVDEKAGDVYFSASLENPTQLYLYRCRLDGSGSPERVTPADEPGWHDYEVSADGTTAIHSYSRFGQPPRADLISLADHKTIRPLVINDKLRSNVAKLTPSPVEFFRADAGEGGMLDGWLIKPANFDPTKKYPVLIYVYGEPWGQEVTDRWGGSQYLWHRMLAEKGYAVACFDNRGAKCPRGRDWRKAVYRKIGTVASADQSAALRSMLKERPYLDPTRIGVWGWSGGGSMTLNLMFRHPELYRTGMAVAPVPDVRLYDTIYQERYLGLPQENPNDYRKSSPITYAAGLKGNLLVVHGTGDDNCHYQGTELLANRLIELNKPFTVMPYPNRTHAINEGKNTTRHLHELLTRYLTDNLPAGPGK
jgi:dipeptidyl-peptidase-4